MFMNPLSASGAFDRETAETLARGWWLVAGLTSIVVIAWPEIGLLTLAVFFGAALVARGAAHVAGALAHREAPLWWLILILGLIEIPVGIWALRRPGLTLVVLITLMGVWAIVQGIWECVVAFELRNLPRRLRSRPA